MISTWQELYFGGTAELADIVESQMPLILHVKRQQLEKHLHVDYGMNK